MRFQCTITPFTYLHSMFQCWDQFIIHKGNWETTDAPYVSLLLTSCACHTGCWFQTYFSYFCCFFGVFVKSLLLFHTFPFVFNLTLSQVDLLCLNPDLSSVHFSKQWHRNTHEHTLETSPQPGLCQAEIRIPELNLGLLHDQYDFQ